MSTYDFEPDPDDFGPEPPHIANPSKSKIRRPWVGLTDEDLLTILGGELDSSDEAFLRFGRAVIAHIKQKNT